MNDISGQESALLGYTGPGITWANEVDFSMNHAPGAGSITQPADLPIQRATTVLRHSPQQIAKDVYTNYFQTRIMK